MEMNQVGDSKWDWKSDFSDWKLFYYISFTYLERLGTKSQNWGSIWPDLEELVSTKLIAWGKGWNQLESWVNLFLGFLLIK